MIKENESLITKISKNEFITKISKNEFIQSKGLPMIMAYLFMIGFLLIIIGINGGLLK